MLATRVTVFVGHFGSGKTEIALHAALAEAERGNLVSLADLDVVKPYFRSRAAKNLLADHGVELIAPTGDHAFGDLPIVLPRVREVLGERSRRVILDAGGDPTGARVLGSLADVMPADASCLLVLNFNRPSTPDPEHAVRVIGLIERVARMKVSGLVANTHLMDFTDAAVVLSGLALAEQTAALVGIPVVAVVAEARLAGELERVELPCPLVTLERIVKPPFELSAPGPTGQLLLQK